MFRFSLSVWRQQQSFKILRWPYQIAAPSTSLNVIINRNDIHYRMLSSSRLGDKDHTTVQEFRKTEEGVEKDYINREEKALLVKILKKLGTDPSSVESIRTLETILSRRGIPLSLELRDELVAWKAGTVDVKPFINTQGRSTQSNRSAQA